MEDYKKQTIGAYDSDPGFFVDFFKSRFASASTDLDRYVSELKGSRVLDIGCGPGLYLDLFREKGLDALGIDLSDGFLDICARKGLNVRKMDLEAPLLYPYSFDGIWASASLLHVPRVKVPSVIAAWTRLLKPRSILFVSVKMGFGEGYVPNPNDADRKRYFTYFSVEEFLSLFSSRFDLVEGSYGMDGEWIKGLFRLKPGPPRAFHNF
mgnify:CR=1 FL=1